MNKRRIALLTMGLVIALTGILSLSSTAATNFLSQGRLELNNNTPNNSSDDVVFDADDLKTLDTKLVQLTTDFEQLENEVEEGKNELLEELEKNPNVDIDEPDPSFPTIIEYILQMTDVPANTYFYAEGTEGSNAIERYKKVAGIYYPCDANGKVATGAAPVDVSQKTLHAYSATTDNELSAGAAGYADGIFYLGNGSDNHASYTQGFVDGQSNVMENLNVEYHYHEHEGASGSTANGCYNKKTTHSHSNANGCYKYCTGNYPNWWADSMDEFGNQWYTSRCTVCGYEPRKTNDYTNGEGCGRRILTCTISTTAVTYQLGCGKDETSIDSVTITY